MMQCSHVFLHSPRTHRKKEVDSRMFIASRVWLVSVKLFSRFYGCKWYIWLLLFGTPAAQLLLASCTLQICHMLLQKKYHKMVTRVSGTWEESGQVYVPAYLGSGERLQITYWIGCFVWPKTLLDFCTRKSVFN